MNKKDDKIQIIRDLFIPWILEDYDQEGISKAWSSGETIEEIRHRTMGNYFSQNRCVTKEDFDNFDKPL